MSVEENKALVRRFIEEVFNRWEQSAVEELLAPDYLQHDPVWSESMDREHFKQTYPLFRSAFTDLRFAAEDLIGEGDKVVARYTFRGTHQGDFQGAAPTGEPITGTGIGIFRLEDGKVAEVWVEWDRLGLMQQVGTSLRPDRGDSRMAEEIGHESNRDELLQLEHVLQEAVRRQDRDVLERLVGEAFSLTSPRMSIRRDDWIASATGPFQTRSFRFEHIEVQDYGYVAVASIRYHQDSTYEGQPAAPVWDITDVWIRRNGAWQIVKRHASVPA